MINFFKRIVQIAIMLLVGSVYAAGQIDLVDGNVNITNKLGELRIPARGQRVEAGDVITTGRDGEIHIITDDNGLLALRANTTLVIDTYRAEGGQNDNVVLRLLRGTFRSITGWVGKLYPNNYQVHTPAATIGIRGTDHEPLVVEYGPEAGTYEKVNAGRTQLETPFGKIEIGPNQAGFARKDGSQPPALLAKIPAEYKPSVHEDVIEKTRAMLGQSLDEKLKEKQRNNIRKGVDSAGKPRIGELKDGRDALAALEQMFRAYETGNTVFLRDRLDPGMIGYQRLMDGIVVESNQCKQIRLLLLDTQIQAGPDLVVIQSAWEKRCLQMPNFTARFNTGRSTFLMHKGAGGWSMAAISGTNPLASTTGVLGIVTASTTTTCAAINALGGALGGAGGAAGRPVIAAPGALAGRPVIAAPVAMPFTITITDPDLANVPSITVQVSSGADIESIIIPAFAAGVFQKTTLLISNGAAIPGNGVLNILPVGGALAAPICPAVTVSYVDTTVATGTQTVSFIVPIR